jgi:hypothetical protein
VAADSAGLVKARPLEERFWSKVDRSAGDDACWRWTAALRQGYGVIGSGGKYGKTLLAHRVSYGLAFGSIPEGMDIDHKCHVPSCVNPTHLQAVTHAENMQNRSGATARSKSGIRGVSWSRQLNHWVVFVTVRGKTVNGGLYKNIADAERAAVALRNHLMTNNVADRAAA